jgi:hypothetical protein
MTVSGGPTAASRALWRWGPVALSLAALVWAAYFTRLATSFGTRDVTLLIACLLWLLVSLGVAAPAAHKNLVGNLAAIRGLKLIAPAFVALLAAAAFFLRPLAFNWLPVAFALLQAAFATAKPRRTLVSLVAVPALTLLLLDGILAAIRNTPALAHSAALQPLARFLYSLDWTTVHLLPECAEFDARLTYRLRPGACTFSELEFSTHYEINSLGVRDDEQSLDAPEIVVLGDSFAMGWGVEQDEAFPGMLQEQSGRKVLNAAVSSYGTAREFGMLERIDLSRARYLIVQYASNDFEENRLYAAQGNRIPSRDAAWYNGQVEAHTRNRSFRPAKYVYEVYRAWVGTPLAIRLYRSGWPHPRPEEFPGLPSLRDAAAEQMRSTPSRARPLLVSGSSATPAPLRGEADAFLNVLATSPVDLSALQVIVLSFDFDHRRPRPFIAELVTAIRDDPRLQTWNNLHLLDIMPKLGREDYLTIDSHLTPQGHAKVADALMELIRRIEGHESASVPRPPQTFSSARRHGNLTAAWPGHHVLRRICSCQSKDVSFYATESPPAPPWPPAFEHTAPKAPRFHAATQMTSSSWDPIRSNSRVSPGVPGRAASADRQAKPASSASRVSPTCSGSAMTTASRSGIPPTSTAATRT